MGQNWTAGEEVNKRRERGRQEESGKERETEGENDCEVKLFLECTFT